MIDLRQGTNGMLDTARLAQRVATAAQALPGFVAAISVGGLSASVTHLLPILFGSDARNDS